VAAQSGLGSLARPDLTVCHSERLRGRYRGPAVSCRARHEHE